MAAKKTATTKAATTKAPAKKPAQKVTKKTPAKKPVTKAPVETEEEEVEEKSKLSWKQKLAIGAAAVTGLAGAILLHGRSKYNEGAANQAAVDINEYSNRPTEVNVNLVTGNTNVEGLDMGDEPIVEAEAVEDPIE